MILHITLFFILLPRLHDLLSFSSSDRDSKFLSSVWTEFCKIASISQLISVSLHQQTNDGAESMVKMFKTAIIMLLRFS